MHQPPPLHMIFRPSYANKEKFYLSLCLLDRKEQMKNLNLNIVFHKGKWLDVKCDEIEKKWVGTFGR